METSIIKGVKTKIFHAFLTYTPKSCPKCGVINNSFDDIIKWNWKKNCKVKIKSKLIANLVWLEI